MPELIKRILELDVLLLLFLVVLTFLTVLQLLLVNMLFIDVPVLLVDLSVDLLSVFNRVSTQVSQLPLFEHLVHVVAPLLEGRFDLLRQFGVALQALLLMQVHNVLGQGICYHLLLLGH